MSPRDPRQPLREADAAFQSTALPPQVLARLRRRIFEKAPSSRLPWLVAATAAAVLLAIAFVTLRARGGAEDVRLASGEHYVVGAAELVAVTPSLLHRDGDQLAIRAGEVQVTVEPRRAGQQPVRIAVSHGTLEVVGTRFTIRQRVDGGTVEVHDGVVRFLSDRVTREVAAGESLEWPVKLAAASPTLVPEATVAEPPAEPTSVPPNPAKKQRPRPTRAEPAVIRETDAAWLLEEVDLLRSRREYGEAVRLLDKGLAGIVSARTRERFSFELGSILTYQQGDSTRACRQWKAHEAAFPGGRYAAEVQSAMEKAGCDSH